MDRIASQIVKEKKKKQDKKWLRSCSSIFALSIFHKTVHIHTSFIIFSILILFSLFKILSFDYL